MRVTREENSWGTLINKQVTRWVGSRQIDMRARGTQKLGQKPRAHIKQKTQAHGQQTNHHPCAKQDDEHAANEKTHKPRVHTRQHEKHTANEYTSCVPHSTTYNINCTQPIETRTACNTTKTHVDKSARLPSELETAHSHNDRKGARVSEPRHVTKTQEWVPGSKHHALQHETRHADERARDTSTLEATRSHENADMMWVSGLCHKTMNNTRPKWQNPDKFVGVFPLTFLRF